MAGGVRSIYAGLGFLLGCSSKVQFYNTAANRLLCHYTHPCLANTGCSVGIFKFDFEEQDLDEDTVRRLVWREMMYYQQS